MHVDIDGVAPCRQHGGDAVLRQPPGKVVRLPDAVLQIGLVDDFVQSRGNGHDVVAAEPTIGVVAEGQNLFFLSAAMPISSWIEKRR